MTFAERRDALVREWSAYVWVEEPDSYDDLDDSHDASHYCNCYDCREERSSEILPDLVKKIYDIGFIPRALDPARNFNDTEPDAYYEEGDQRIVCILNDIERIRKANNRTLARWKEEGLTNLKRKVRYCYDCGTVHLLKGAFRYKKVGGKMRTFCPHCASRYITCNHCKKVDLKYNSVQLPDGSRICRPCYEQHYRLCNCCNRVKPKKHFKDFPTKKNDRGQVVFFSLCTECSVDMYKCDMCKTEVPRGICQQYGQVTVCPACGEHFTAIHRHAYSPLDMKFHSSPKEGKVGDSTLYFGFELEIESNNSWINDRTAMAQMLKEKAGLDRVYMVQDGSLSHGVEMVSFPFTWEKFKEDRDHWTEVLRYAKSKGWESDFGGIDGHTVGMHIHTSKAAWGTFQIYKMMAFMYNPSHRDLLQIIGQRRANQYCRFSSADEGNIAKLAKDKKNQDATHYNVVNLNDKRSYNQAEGGPTIEFRLFSGTLEPLHFFKNIEFTYALYCFTRDLPKNKMNKDALLDYIVQHRRTFSALSEFLGITKGGK